MTVVADPARLGDVEAQQLQVGHAVVQISATASLVARLVLRDAAVVGLAEPLVR